MPRGRKRKFPDDFGGEPWISEDEGDHVLRNVEVGDNDIPNEDQRPHYNLKESGDPEEEPDPHERPELASEIENELQAGLHEIDDNDDDEDDDDDEEYFDAESTSADGNN